MSLFFTICTNNYLAQAAVLRQSLQQYDPAAPFFLFLCDRKLPSIMYAEFADEVIAISEIEPGLPALAEKYNIIELNTCLKPRVIEYLLVERKAGKVIYLDPDIRLFGGLSYLFEELTSASILLTPHIYTPIPLDDKTPGENTFLRFGIYNLGFIGVTDSEESLRFIRWWKEWTYQRGYIDTYKGFFVDQLPVSHAPVFFRNVTILRDMGLNMAPWNLHERYLTPEGNRYRVNGDDLLKFYHFSSFGVDANELPLEKYNRFTLAERRDLKKLYDDYNEALKAAGYAFYSRLTCYYAQKSASPRSFFFNRLKRSRR